MGKLGAHRGSARAAQRASIAPVRDRSRASALVLGAVFVSMVVACGKPKPPKAAPVTASTASAGKPEGSAPLVTPSRLLPELVGSRGLVASEEGQRRFLVDRMRLLARGDGSISRAAELLPGGNVSSVALPSRLGGGYLFHVNAGGGTEIWRASSWLGKLRPLTRRGEVVSEIVPGFDRLYVRLTSGHRVIALDPDTGEQMPLGSLPVAGSYGQLAFADGWRAVVDVDLRGPLATFDGGNTWRALGIPEKPLGVGIFDGDPGVMVTGARYLVDARGVVSHRPDTREKRPSGDDGDPRAARSSPLGKRPLRTTVEDGWPDSKTTALVARGGALARVSLRDGSIEALREDAYPDARATCHGVRLGPSGIGFICGERDSATVVYEHVPPLAMRAVLRFDRPRFVSANGNGGLTLRGRCEGEGAPDGDADARWYCVRSPAGATREIRVKGFDLGVERVIGLADGRVAVLVPPRGGSAGDLSIVGVDGHAQKVTLAIPDEPREAVRQIKRGLWLDGFEERSPGVLGGWVEAGGPVVGVEIGLDGKVKPGDLQADVSGAIVGGRYAVLLLDGGRAMESSDGGMTYRSFDLPDRDDEARAAPTRAAGPVGAALPGWVRVGWGDPETPEDMKPAATPKSQNLPLKVSPTIGLSCELASVATPPLPDKPKPAAAPPPPRRHGIPVRAVGRGAGVAPWATFRNTPAPALGGDEVGVDHGTGDPVGLRAYAWGKKGADWSRTGRWLMRFDDRFDPSGGVRSTAPSASLWPDEATAFDAIAGRSYGSMGWTGTLDPGGRAMLVSGCYGSACALFAAGEGQPISPIRDASRAGASVRPYAQAAVRVGDTWFFLAQSANYDAVTLWRVDLGSARPLTTYYRPIQRYGYETPRLTRRAVGSGVAILVGGQPEKGDRTGSWYVIPVDPETGALGESVVLARRDFAGVPLPRCAPEQDGWVFDVKPETTVAIDVTNARGSMDQVEMRVRVDPGRACVDGFAARTSAFYASGAAPQRGLTAPPGRKGGDAALQVPLSVNEISTGRRWGLSCKIK